MRNSERTPALVFLLAPLACCLVASLAGRATAADDKKGQPADRHAEIGKLLTPSGSLVWREKSDAPWHVAKEGDAVRTGDLLLAIPFAFLDIDGGVRLELLADLEKRSPFPIIETAVVLHDRRDADLDLTLDRAGVGRTRRPGQLARTAGEEADHGPLPAAPGREGHRRRPGRVHQLGRPQPPPGRGVRDGRAGPAAAAGPSAHGDQAPGRLGQ